MSSFLDDNIMNSTLEYLDEVMEILESFDYPDMVLYFAPEDVARSIALMCGIMKVSGQSPMMCAIIIWSLTLKYQLMNSNKVVH